MPAVHMAVGIENEFAAVAVTLPFGNYLHITTALDRSRNEHATQCTLTVGRKGEPLARIAKRLARIVDLKQTFIVRLALTQSFNQGSSLRINRNCKTLGSLVPVNNDLSTCEIDITAGDRR